MQRFGTILKEFEATVAREGVYVEGAPRVVITPIPYWICGVDAVDLYSEKRMKELNKQKWFGLSADDRRSGGMVSCIHRLVQAGRIALHDKVARLHN